MLIHDQDVKQLPGGANTPKGLHVEELDIYVESLVEALSEFDRSSSIALEDAAVLSNVKRRQVDIMPREEVFLISSFILNFRQAATHVLRMLRHCRVLVERREARRGRKRIYYPQIDWRRWMTSGENEGGRPSEGGGGVTEKQPPESQTHEAEDHESEDDDTTERLLRDHEDGPARLPFNRTMKRRDSNAHRSPTRKRHRAQKAAGRGFFLQPREVLADTLDYLQTSDDVLYTLKLAIATFIVSFPALVPAWNQWYFRNRGIWAAFQLVYVFEVAIGSTITAFLVRAVGTITGCLWGWAAYESRNGDRAVTALLLAIGLVPCAYVQLTSKHFKAGQVAMISMTVVALATELESRTGEIISSSSPNPSPLRVIEITLISIFRQQHRDLSQTHQRLSHWLHRWRGPSADAVPCPSPHKAYWRPCQYDQVSLPDAGRLRFGR